MRPSFSPRIGAYALTSQETRLWLLAKRLSTSRVRPHTRRDGSIRTWGDPAEEDHHQKFRTPPTAPSAVASAPQQFPPAAPLGGDRPAFAPCPRSALPGLRMGLHRQGKPCGSFGRGCGLDRVGQQQHAGRAGSGHRQPGKNGLAWGKIVRPSGSGASSCSLPPSLGGQM
jgi:hypothetical protein